MSAILVFLLPVSILPVVTIGIKRSWYGDMFTTNYLTTMNAWREIRKAINNDEDPRFSMAQILKVAAMHRVTDTYTLFLI